VAYDPERFARVYVPELPTRVTAAWTLVGLSSDRVRAAIDASLVDARGAGLTVFVERRVEGGECLAQTARLQLSYYGDAVRDHASAAEATRALAALFLRVEEDATPEALDGALETGARSPTGRARALELRINRECNEACIFCNTPEGSQTILPGPDAILAAIRRERMAGYEHLTLSGRETTLDARLPDYLRAARDAGYTLRRVQTNGTTFASGPLLEELVLAGMTHAELSLHTLEPEVFGRLVGPPRLLEKTLAGLARLAAFDAVTTHLVVVLTRLNVDHLVPVLERATALHPRISQVTVSPMAPVGDGVAHVDLVPRPDELREPLRRAFALAEARGLTLRIPSRCGTPLCVMPEGTERWNDEHDNRPGLTLEAGKAKLPQCVECVYEERCTGLWRACLERWGPDVVTPVRTVPG
jgi:MoaA/NifB/PqqE/SkfB family radical SAM enzyme